MISLPRSISETDISRRNRIILYYFLGIGVVVLTYTIVYNLAMTRLEGVNQSIFASFEFVVQTMTTTGYGQDSGEWSHPLLFMFVSFTQVTGIGIGFFTLRLIIIPLFTGAEVNLDNRLSPKQDHVIVCEYRRDSSVLLDELKQLDIDYVLISSSEESARKLSDEGYAAIHGSPQDADTLERASIDTARAVITDAGNANVNTILTVRSLRPDIEVIALTDDSDHRDVLTETGADSVLSPHGVLGHRLAQKAVNPFSSEVTDTIDLGSDTEVTEIPVKQQSRLVGTRIRNSQIREQTGANIIGAWIDGELQLPPDPDAVIRPNTVLLISGEHDALEEMSEFVRPTRTAQQRERIILAGMGEVGQAAGSVVSEAGIETVGIDTDDHEGVDIVADAGSKAALKQAGVEEAEAIIVGLPDDSTSLLTTVLARSLDPNIEVLTRVSDTDATKKALSAGADYALSVPRVSARMIATELRGEDVLAPASQIRLVRVSASPFGGSTLADSGIYERTGCRVIAIEHESELSSNPDPRREFTGDEQMTVVGSDEAVQQFLTEFDVSQADIAEQSELSSERSPD
jgi:Trk K+ transport system NAD-binding subunit